MKKLKLKLDGNKMLSKDQMKKINGGYTNCRWFCSSTGAYWDGYDFYGSSCPSYDQCGSYNANDMGEVYRVISCECWYS